MSLDLYYTPVNSLYRAKAIGISLNLKEIDIFANEHLKPEYEQVSTMNIYRNFKYC